VQRTLYRRAKQEPERRFHALYGHVHRMDVLRRAWAGVCANRGAPGVDGVSVDAVAASGVDAFLQDLSQRLRTYTYRPSVLWRVNIPKPERPGELRTLSIPTVADRVVMTAAKLVLEPVFEAQFTEAKLRIQAQTVRDRRVRSRARLRESGPGVGVRGRYPGPFRHDRPRCADGPGGPVGGGPADAAADPGLAADGSAGARGDLSDRGGTPQGSPISPLLANVALHALDETWQDEGRRLGVLVRYCDDFVVLLPTGQRAEQARETAAGVLDRLGMQLHPEKSGITCLSRGGRGFDFLGFHHRKVESWKWRGKFYLRRWPSARAMRVLRDKVRVATGRSKTERPVTAVVADLNPVLRGWGAYFRNGNSGRKFDAVDGYVHERPAILASREHGLRGRNWATRFTYGWVTRLGVYRLTGTVRRATAHASR
jgi:hypothetical protein